MHKFKVSELESVEFVEQNQVVTIEMPYESPEEVSIDDELSTDDEYEDIDESDYNVYDSDSQNIDEMEVYNTTEDSNLGMRYYVPHRYNLDIVDNKRCLDRFYHSISSGYKVDIYIIDTGLNYHHNDLR